MFIRFVSREIHEKSLVSEGLFCAAFDLLYDPLLPDDEYYPLRELMDWFNEHLKAPFGYRLRAPSRAPRAIYWFKPTAPANVPAIEGRVYVCPDVCRVR
jgi:hypothetical protein